jgi:hypothetical protein
MRSVLPAEHEIRADFDRDSIVVYQAYAPAIAQAALSAKRFVTPFSFQRMTWIKPSFLWMMHRSNWGQKSGQQRTLAVRITRAGWEKALSLAVLTSFDARIFSSPDHWAEQLALAKIHIQWDPERSLRDAVLPYRSIQIGISRHVIREFVDEWIVSIEDATDRVRKMHELLRNGHADQAKRYLPIERVYPISRELGRSLLIDSER